MIIIILDVIDADGFENLIIPQYISEGLGWLQERLNKKQLEILPVLTGTAS